LISNLESGSYARSRVAGDLDVDTAGKRTGAGDAALLLCAKSGTVKPAWPPRAET
jgi:hypothetical protein